jgi:hypothetical protein
VHGDGVRVLELGGAAEDVDVLRMSWLRITSTSCPTTCWVRAIRSAMVISDLTR